MAVVTELLGRPALHEYTNKANTHVGFVTRVMWVAQLSILQSNTCNEFIFRMACHRGAA